MAVPKMKPLNKLKSALIIACSGSLTFGGIGIYSGNENFFKQFINPILNRLDPEISHRAAVFIAKHHLLRPFSNENDPPNLTTKIGQLKLSNPIGIAAGFDKSAECISGLERFGFGFVEIGSVTPLAQEGNSRPRIFRLAEDLAVINRYGFNNDGHEKVYSRVSKFKKENPNYIVGVNLGANKDSSDRIEDYCKGIKVFSNVADYFVINISSPNTPDLRKLQNSENLNELLQRVIKIRDEEQKKVPIYLKVAPDLMSNDIKTISYAIRQRKQRVDGIIVSNTTIRRDFDFKSDQKLINESGGLSGKPLNKMSTELIKIFYKELKGEKIPIIGVGGISNGEDAFEKICAGASAIQIYTALVFSGHTLVDKIKTELSSLIKEKNFKSIEEAVGSET